mgnify:CR=1 FL=1
MPGIRLSQNAAGHRQLWKMVVAGMALAIMAGWHVAEELFTRAALDFPAFEYKSVYLATIDWASAELRKSSLGRVVYRPRKLE